MFLHQDLSGETQLTQQLLHVGLHFMSTIVTQRGTNKNIEQTLGQ